MLKLGFILFFLCSTQLTIEIQGKLLPSNNSYNLNDKIMWKGTNICVSPGCIKIANRYLDNMEPSVDPCEDFFDFACGKYVKETLIPDDQTQYGPFQEVGDEVKKEMKVLLEEPEDNKTNSSKSIRLTKIYYNNCVNQNFDVSVRIQTTWIFDAVRKALRLGTGPWNSVHTGYCDPLAKCHLSPCISSWNYLAKLDTLKSDPFIQALKKLGGWPLVQNVKTNSDITITQLLANVFKNYPGDYFFSLSTDSNWMDANKTALYMDQASLILGDGTRDYYLNDTLYQDTMDALKKYVKTVIMLLAGDTNFTNVSDKDIDDLLAFEKLLANITVKDEDRQNFTQMYHSMTLAQLSDIIPSIDWALFFKTISDDDVYKFIKKSDFRIIVLEPGYLANLNKILKETDKKIIINYVFLRFFLHYTSALDVRYEDAEQDFFRVFQGRQQKPIKWKACIDTVIDQLKFSSGALYVRRHFTESSKKETLEIVKQIQKTFKDMVKKLDWMDEPTKKAALEKAEYVTTSIGYPDFIVKSKSLDDYYKKLDFQDSDSYFEISKTVKLWEARRQERNLLKPYDRTEFAQSPALVNGYNNLQQNSINFLAAILRQPFFASDVPKYVNYGAAGTIIGHELTHSFDNLGAQYNKYGGLENWWSEKSFDQFRDKMTCMIKQYDQYISPGTTTHLSGQRTIGENIADNGGFKEAFTAYNNFMKQQTTDDQMLPGLAQFTPQQLFFISFANAFCSKMTPAAAVSWALTNPHSPGKFRINGVLANSEEFATVFQCKVGSGLNQNPTKHPRCSVW